MIRDQRLDIIVDLAGHSGFSRLPLLARRLAPVQVLWCGYSGTSGIETMDYIIVDDVLAPPGEKTYLSEAPLRLPASYVCFTPRGVSLEPGPLPFERNGFTTFGCMNNPSKINKYVVGWWAEILKAVPDSVLLMRYALFVDPLVRERIAKMFRECGIPDNRYQMLEGKAEFMSVYQDVDIALDTFPYNGTTTTCEALWMGVPVVVLRGDRFVSRVGASLLTYTGLKDLITESPQQYIDLAVQLARDPKQVGELRQQLRGHLPNTPVFTPKAFIKGLETRYFEAFSKWYEKSVPYIPEALAV
jgi:predicted O-linked N-acetylglucosamine transferase (SPINDLY family)